MPDMAFRAGDNSPRTLQSGGIYGFLRLYFLVFPFYTAEIFAVCRFVAPGT